MNRIKGPFFTIIVVAILAAIAIPILPSYYVSLMAQVLIFAIFAMSLDLIVGVVGLPSLGHAAYFGTGAYVAGLISLRVSPNFWLNVVAAAIVSLIIAAIFGLLVMRTVGPTFLMITMALAQLLWGIVYKWREIANGEDGLPGVPRPNLGFAWDLVQIQSFTFFVVLCFLVCGLLLVIYVKSPFGSTLLGIRESESRMRALGYNVWLYKYIAYLSSAMVASFSGVLFVYYNNFINPNYLSMNFSAKAMLMVILGGAGTLVGPIFGSLVVVMLENVVSNFTQRWMTMIGLTYVIVVLFFPKGVLGTIRQRLEIRRAGAATAAAAAKAVAAAEKESSEVGREAAGS